MQASSCSLSSKEVSFLDTPVITASLLSDERQRCTIEEPDSVAWLCEYWASDYRTLSINDQSAITLRSSVELKHFLHFPTMEFKIASIVPVAVRATERITIYMTWKFSKRMKFFAVRVHSGAILQTGNTI
jgi:hypothetical protein